jgi:hypothetical protein
MSIECTGTVLGRTFAHVSTMLQNILYQKHWYESLDYMRFVYHVGFYGALVSAEGWAHTTSVVLDM